MNLKTTSKGLKTEKMCCVASWRMCCYCQINTHTLQQTNINEHFLSHLGEWNTVK